MHMRKWAHLHVFAAGSNLLPLVHVPKARPRLGSSATTTSTLSSVFSRLLVLLAAVVEAAADKKEEEDSAAEAFKDHRLQAPLCGRRVSRLPTVLSADVPCHAAHAGGGVSTSRRVLQLRVTPAQCDGYEVQIEGPEPPRSEVRPHVLFSVRCEGRTPFAPIILNTRKRRLPASIRSPKSGLGASSVRP